MRLTPIAVTMRGKAVGRIQVGIGPDPTVKYPDEHAACTPGLARLAALRHAASEAWSMTALQARLSGAWCSARCRSRI